jgi:outer membrane protein assembly factor BamB
LIDTYTGYIIVGSTDGNLYIINPSTATAGTLTTSSAIYSSPVEDQGRVYFGDDNGDLICYDPATSALCSGWTPPHTGGAIRSTAAIAGGAVYITSRDGHLYAYDENSGAELWAAGLPVTSVSGKPFNSSPAVADGVVYVGGTNGDLYAFYTSTGQLVPGFPKATDGFPITSSPAIGQGSVVFTTGDGSVWQLLRSM